MANVAFTVCKVPQSKHLNDFAISYNFNYVKRKLSFIVACNQEVTSEIYDLIKAESTQLVLYRLDQQRNVLYAELLTGKLIDAIDLSDKKELIFEIVSVEMQTNTSNESKGGSSENETDKQEKVEKKSSSGANKETKTKGKKTVNTNQKKSNPTKK